MPMPGPNDLRLALAADCPSRLVLTHVTSKWGVPTVLALAGGTRRWNELRDAIDGVSEKMLAQTLRALADDGFVVRDQKPTLPPHVEYSLTEVGREIAELLLPLVERVARHVGDEVPWTRC